MWWWRTLWKLKCPLKAKLFVVPAKQKILNMGQAPKTEFERAGYVLCVRKVKKQMFVYLRSVIIQKSVCGTLSVDRSVRED